MTTVMNEEEADDAAAFNSVPDVLSPRHFVLRFGRSVFLCPSPVKTAKHQVKVESLAHLNSLIASKNLSSWPLESLTLAHFCVFCDVPGGKPRAFFTVDYSGVPEGDRASFDPSAEYIDEHVVWPVPKAVGPLLAQELGNEDVYFTSDDSGARVLKAKWTVVLEALNHGSQSVSPHEARWTKFPPARFVTRRLFPKAASSRDTDEGAPTAHEVATGEVIDVPAGAMATTFVPFAARGVSYQVAVRSTGVVVYQFPPREMVGGGAKRARDDEGPAAE